MKHYILPLLLAGCSSYSMPPVTPTPEAIRLIRDRVEAIDMPLQDYVDYGTTLAAMNCINWFGDQIARSSQSATIAGELGLLGTAAGVAGGPAGAAAAAAMAFGIGSLNNIQSNSPVGADPLAAYVLTSKVQRVQRNAAGTPTTKAEAYAIVEDNAEKCQLPEIRRAQHDAIMTAPVTVNQPVESFGLGQPARPLLPDITVGYQPASPAITELPRSRRKVSSEPPVGSTAWFRLPRYRIRSLDGPR